MKIEISKGTKKKKTIPNSRNYKGDQWPVTDKMKRRRKKKQNIVINIMLRRWRRRIRCVTHAQCKQQLVAKVHGLMMKIKTQRLTINGLSRTNHNYKWIIEGAANFFSLHIHSTVSWNVRTHTIAHNVSFFNFYFSCFHRRIPHSMK